MASALIQGGATLATGGLAAWIVMYQVGRQGRDGLRQARHAEQLRLKLEVYDKMRDVIGRASTAILDFSRLLNQLQYICLPDWSDPLPDGRVRVKPSSTGQELIDHHAQLGLAVADAIILIEQWSIVDPRLDLFRDAFNVAAHEIREKWTPLFVSVGVRLPPVELDGAEMDAWRAPSPDACAAAIPACQALQDAVSLAECWLADFQTELQRLLLRDLFENRLPYRDAPDPRFFTIRLDRYDQLKKRLGETAWGREAVRLEEQARAKAEAAGPASIQMSSCVSHTAVTY